MDRSEYWIHLSDRWFSGKTGIIFVTEIEGISHSRYQRLAALVFWKAALIIKKKGKQAKDELKHLRRISLLAELSSQRDLLAYIKLAMHFNEPGTKLPPREKRSGLRCESRAI